MVDDGCWVVAGTDLERPYQDQMIGATRVIDPHNIPFWTIWRREETELDLYRYDLQVVARKRTNEGIGDVESSIYLSTSPLPVLCSEPPDDWR
jgi:hypothetical protein